jgi:hypothetical protein
VSFLSRSARTGLLPPALAVAVTILAAACVAVGSTGSAAPSTADGSASPTASVAPSTSVAPSPTALESLPVELGPAPKIEYPEVQALGVGTIILTHPTVGATSFWVTCEWSTTAGVAWIYPKPVTILGESVSPSLTIEGETPFFLSREGDVASYVPTAATTETVEHNEDWTNATITFSNLTLNPEWWTGPFPTPKAAFERPLGGHADAASLTGTVDWACGPRPATVPTPGPSTAPEPRPSFPFDHLPDATIHVGDEWRVGKPGCGVSWEGYGSGGADSCGPSYQVLGADAAVHGTVHDALRFSLPAGFRYTDYALFWVDQPTAEHWRGLAPPDMEHRAGVFRIDESTIGLKGLPVGDWSLFLVWSGSDGKLTVTGQPDYFRVIIR